nr:reverse transcriptase domain-containing protein [Tanacetum cinerariifolium]
MRTRFSSNQVGETSTNPNPKGRDRRRSKQRVKPFSLEETLVVTMVDQRTMAELLRAPTEGYAEAIVVPPIPAKHFELNHSLINLVTSKQFFGFEKEDPHAHIRYFNKITSTLKYKDVPEYSIKLMLFPFSIDGPARILLDKEPSRSILTWDDLVSKFINHFFPPSKTTNLQNEILNFQQRFDESFYEAWNCFKDLLQACPHHGFIELHQLDAFYNGLNPSDQDSLNSSTDGNLLERSAQDVLKIIENKSKVRNSRNKPIVSQGKASNADSSEITSVVASAVTSVMTAMFKQHQVTPSLAFVKDVKESCVTCGGAHSYRQCPTIDGHTFSGYQDNIQGYVSAAAVNYNQGNTGYRPQSVANQFRPPGFAQPNVKNQRPLPSNTIANLKCELKAITTRSGIVLDGPSVPMPPSFINSKEDEREEETLTDPKLVEYTIKKMLKGLLSNKEKLLELTNTPLNENCSAVILKKLPEKLGDPRKFLIPCGFSELKCKALANLGASINLMPLLVWKKLGLPELISTRMTLELANRSVCTPAGIARDVFVMVGRFTFPTDFVIVNYESDPRVPLILGRPFLRTARALIDVYGEELILHDCDERLILNMKHDTSSYSNKPQRESINMIDIYNISYEYYLEDLFANEKITNHLSGNPTFSSEPDTLTSDLTSPEVKDGIFDPKGDIVLIKKLLNLNSTKDLPPSHNTNPLSGSTTSSSPSLTTFEINDYSLEEFVDELALIESFPSGNDDMTLEDVIREIEYLLNHDRLVEYSPNNDLIYTILEMFTDEHTLDYSSPPRYDDPFDSKENKIKDSKHLINELDSPGSSSFLPHFLESDSVLYEDFYEVDTLTSTDNEDKVFNPGILVHENLYEVTNRVAPDKNVKKISSSNASLILEDYNPPLSDHELPFHIEILGSETLQSFSSKNKEKVFNLGILISKGVRSLLPELSHRDSKAFKVINIFESPMEIFPCSYEEDIRVLDVPCFHFYPP